MPSRLHVIRKTERPPRGGLSEIRSGVLIRRLLAPSASCASQADLTRRGRWRRVEEREEFGTVASLMTAAWTHPVEFVRVVASLVPRELEATTTVHMERMSDAQLEALIARGIEGGLDPAAPDEDANMTVSENPLSRSLLGVKRT